MESRLWYLKGCELFAHLTLTQLTEIERNSRVRAFNKGSLIYVPNDAVQDVLIVAKGRVKIKDLTKDGKEIILVYINEGELFGELAILDESPRQEFAEAMLDSEIVIIPREVLLKLIAEVPDVALSIVKLFGWRRRRVENRLRNILFISSRERMIRLLQELVEDHGDQNGNECTLRFAISHQELASLIGVTRETVTAVMGELRAEQLLCIRKRRIIILDCNRLKVLTTMGQ